MTDSHADRLVLAVALLEKIRPVAGDIAITVALDRLTFTATAAELRQLPISALLALAADGHTVRLDLDVDGWSCNVVAERGTNPSITSDGDPSWVLDSTAVLDFEQAVASRDAAEALRVAGELPAALQVVIRNDPLITGFSWIRSTGDLADALTGSRWRSTVGELAGGPGIVFVPDADGELRTAHLLVSDFTPATTPPPVPAAPGAADGRRPLPSPELFADPRATGRPLTELLATLAGLTRLLVWYHLATSVAEETDGTAVLRFDGARRVDLHLRPTAAADGAGSDLELYRWFTAGGDPARGDSAVRAATLAIYSDADLPSAAAPVLRTARLLYDLSRKGEIAEALASRRAARDAALSMARAAAETARQVSGKAVERSLVQLGAAIAIVLSNGANLVGRGPALWLLGMVIALAGTALAVSLRTEVPHAVAALQAAKDDLHLYRETLSTEDLAAVRNLRVVAAAEEELASTRWVVASVYGVAMTLVLLVGGSLVLFGTRPAGVPSPPGTPTAVTVVVTAAR